MPTMRLAPASTSDYRRLAEKRLPRMLFDYIDGAAGEEVTLAANDADFKAIRLRQQVMRDVSEIDTTIKLFGEECAMPLALAPIGLGGMMARRGEILAARAAEAAGLPFCLSTVAICSIEEVARAVAKPFWFQLYMMKDRGHVRELLERAKAAGCETLVFTVDLAVAGVRYRDVRNGMGGGVSMFGKLRAGAEYLTHPSWVHDVGVMGKPHVFGSLAEFYPNVKAASELKKLIDAQFDASVTWKDIEWLRRQWDGNLVIKGVMTAEDAVAATDAGADAIVVSNHGGRQLDGVASSITVTPGIVDAVGDRAAVLMNGGVRCGKDVAAALAYGAKAVLIGRPWIWALAAQGERGLKTLLRTLKAEMEVCMALTGAPTIADITSDTLDKT